MYYNKLARHTKKLFSRRLYSATQPFSAEGALRDDTKTAV